MDWTLFWAFASFLISLVLGSFGIWFALAMKREADRRFNFIVGVLIGYEEGDGGLKKDLKEGFKAFADGLIDMNSEESLQIMGKVIGSMAFENLKARQSGQKGGNSGGGMMDMLDDENMPDIARKGMDFLSRMSE